MVELKEALTLDEQIERLITIHKLVITDKSSAKDILKKVNYYRLSAYGIGLKNKNNPEEYIDGITLEHIYRLYCYRTVRNPTSSTNFKSSCVKIWS